MTLRNAVEKGVNAVLILGFLVLVLGIGLWVLSASQSAHLSAEAMLIILGCMFLFFGALAARVFSKVGD
jgi:cytochrome c biogenesis protein CcdA